MSPRVSSEEVKKIKQYYNNTIIREKFKDIIDTIFRLYFGRNTRYTTFIVVGYVTAQLLDCRV